MTLTVFVQRVERWRARDIAVVRFVGRRVGHHTSFVCVRVAAESAPNTLAFVLPVEVEVSARPGLFAPVAAISFGAAPIVVPAPAHDQAAARAGVAWPRALASPFVATTLVAALESSAFAVRSYELYVANTAPSHLEIKVAVSPLPTHSLSPSHHRAFDAART